MKSPVPPEREKRPGGTGKKGKKFWCCPRDATTDDGKGSLARALTKEESATLSAGKEKEEKMGPGGKG